MYLYLIAPTGTGKTMIFSTVLIDKLPRSSIIVLLQPKVTAAWNAYHSITSYITDEKIQDITVEIQVGDRNPNNHAISGKGSKKILILTYGKFNTQRDHYLCTASYVLVDEAHVRNDPTIIETQVYLSKDSVLQRKTGQPGRPIYLTATDCGFEKFGKNLGPAIAPSGTKFDIHEEVAEYTLNNIEPDHYVLDLDKAGGRGAKHPAWKGKKIRILKSDMEQKRTLIFVPTIDHTKKFETQILEQNPNLHVFTFFAGCGLSLENLPPDCIIVTTDALGMAVTVTDVNLVIDLGLEIRPQVAFEFITSNKYSYIRQLECQPISSQDHLQRKGRTGRTCEGKCVTLSINFKPIEMWQASLLYELIWTIGRRTKWCIRTFNEYISDVGFQDVRKLLQENSRIHPVHLNIDISKAEICSEIDSGDPICLTLKSIISKEWITKQESTEEADLKFHHKSIAVENIDWVRKYKAFYPTDQIVEKIADEKVKMESIGRVALSDANDVPDTEWNIDAKLMGVSSSNAQLYIKRFKKISKAKGKPAAVTNPTTSFVPSRTYISSSTSRTPSILKIEGSDEEDSLTPLIPILATFGSIIAGGMITKALVRQFGSKFMVRVGYCNKDTVAGTIMNYTNLTKQDIYTMTWIDAIIEYLKAIVSKLKRTGRNLYSKVTGKHSLAPPTPPASSSSSTCGSIPESSEDSGAEILFLEQIKVFCLANWPTLCTPLAATGGLAGMLGGLTVDAFTNIFSPAIAVPLCIVITGMITVCGGILPGLATTLIASLAYLLKTTLTNPSHIKKQLNPYINKCGSGLVVGGLVGTAVGYALSPQIVSFLTKTVLPAPSTSMIQLSNDSVMYNLGRNPSNFSNHIIVAKHIYMLCSRMVAEKKMDGAAIVGALLEIAFHAVDNLGFQIIYTIIAVIALVGFRCLLEHFEQEHILRGGSAMKSETAYRDWRANHTAWPEWFDTFIAAVACISDLTSLLTIVLHWLDYWANSTGDNLNKKQFVQIFEDHAGVNGILGLFLFLGQKMIDIVNRNGPNVTNNSGGLDFAIVASVLAGLPASLMAWWDTIKKFMGLESVEEDASGFIDSVIPYLQKDSKPKKVFNIIKGLAVEDLKQNNLIDTEITVLQCIQNCALSTAPDILKLDVRAKMMDYLIFNSNLFFNAETLNRPDFDKDTVCAAMTDDLLEWDRTRRLPGAISSMFDRTKRGFIWIYEKVKNFFFWLWQLVKTATKAVLNTGRAMITEIGHCLGVGIRGGIFSWGNKFKVTDTFKSIDARAASFDPKNLLNPPVALSKLVKMLMHEPSSVNCWIGQLVIDSVNAPKTFEIELLSKVDKEILSTSPIFSVGTVNIPLELFKILPYHINKHLSQFYASKVSTDGNSLEIDVLGNQLLVSWRWNENELEFKLELTNTILYGVCLKSSSQSVSLTVVSGGAFNVQIAEIFMSLVGMFPDTELFTISSFKELHSLERVKLGSSLDDWTLDKTFMEKVKQRTRYVYGVVQTLKTSAQTGELPNIVNAQKKKTRELLHRQYVALNSDRETREKLTKNYIDLIDCRPHTKNIGFLIGNHDGWISLVS